MALAWLAAHLAKRAVPGMTARRIVTDQPRRIAVVKSYDDLLAALRERVSELKISQTGLDEDCNLTRGHVNKLIGPVPVKSFGRETFGPIIQALGLMLIVVEDPVTLQNSSRLVRRKKNIAHASAGMLPLKRRKKRGFWHNNKTWSAILNSRRFLKLPELRRQEIARMAAKTRWNKPGARGKKKPLLRSPLDPPQVLR